MNSEDSQRNPTLFRGPEINGAPGVTRTRGTRIRKMNSSAYGYLSILIIFRNDLQIIFFVFLYVRVVLL